MNKKRNGININKYLVTREFISRLKSLKELTLLDGRTLNFETFYDHYSLKPVIKVNNPDAEKLYTHERKEYYLITQDGGLMRVGLEIYKGGTKKFLDIVYHSEEKTFKINPARLLEAMGVELDEEDRYDYIPDSGYENEEEVVTSN
jgi:hypothetical protein